MYSLYLLNDTAILKGSFFTITLASDILLNYSSLFSYIINTATPDIPSLPNLFSGGG
jgi:hypothetical protein